MVPLCQQSQELHGRGVEHGELDEEHMSRLEQGLGTQPCKPA